ncbi:MAG TPA: GTPase HflX [Chitinophagales bacterium]|nr:GTPase HflX [Chitinophagales bacterium]HMX04758.1 GTPase HflX [Chitinophagales bacterium]HMZ88213.1 GTPase HflX [Chitinophagales bacterium]HNA58696.1 GTPase HflX [Chitinophagales bacterium]HNE44616.1 GTPase HflX [Chitinophagales bacterium]
MAHKPTIKPNETETCILVGLVTKDQTLEQLNEFLDELEFLAETAGAVTKAKFYQKLPHPDTKSYVGKGKLFEIMDYVVANEIDIVIFDDEISPSQLRNIEETLKVKVLDRSMLILDIFATRAQTVQAKTQVELAQTQYMLPRLKGLWGHLDRIKGGIGMRGAGEKEIETDRRVAQQRIALLKQQLEKIGLQNETQRKNRGELIRVALVGYTNVGKSTLMNLLSKSEVFAENKLFATLDTTVRKVVLDRTPFLLSDTVGFIRKLPHHLIESFKSTLDEVRESDILLHVVDVSHPAFEEHIHVVNETLKELEAIDKPTILIFNKMDAYEERYFDKYLTPDVKRDILSELENTWMQRLNAQCVFISAINRTNIELLRSMLTDMVKEQYQIRYPYKTEFF